MKNILIFVHDLCSIHWIFVFKLRLNGATQQVSLVYIRNFFALFVSSKLGLQDENLLSSARLKKKEFNKKIKETENLAQKILGGDYFLLFCA